MSPVHSYIESLLTPHNWIIRQQWQQFDHYPAVH